MTKPNLQVAASTEIKIEKGVPMPATSKYYKYPWLQMEVGDSFIYSAKYGHQAATVATLRYSPKKFRYAKSTDEKYYIWRIA